MNVKQLALFAVTLGIFLHSQAVPACTWAVFTMPEADKEPDIALVGRTMDWEHSDNAVVRGVKAGAELSTAEAQYNPLRYTAKFASIQITGFTPDLITEALNEKGLQGSVLYLEGTKLPDYRENLPGIDPGRFLGYAVSMFDSVEQVVRFLKEGKVNFVHIANPVKPGSASSAYLPFHYAFADASGGRAIVEFINGETKIYSDWSDNALTNEPPYSVHKALERARYIPNGSISTIDRRARAQLYIADMYKGGRITGPATAIMSMRGLLASVFAGTEEVDRSETPTGSNEAKDYVYPTQWWTVVDLKNPTYYLTRIDSWHAEMYDFSQVEAMPEDQGTL